MIYNDELIEKVATAIHGIPCGKRGSVEALSAVDALKAHTAYLETNGLVIVEMAPIVEALGMMLAHTDEPGIESEYLMALDNAQLAMIQAAQKEN